jgi:hypothetical protein
MRGSNLSGMSNVDVQFVGSAAAKRIVTATHNENHHWAVAIRKTLTADPDLIQRLLYRDLRNAADEFSSSGESELSMALQKYALML